MKTTRRLQIDLAGKVDAILVEAWNPIGARGLPRNEYTPHVPHLVSLLEGGATAREIAEHLGDLRSNRMGIGLAEPEIRDLLVATRLCALVWK
jgi:hypothetical protein